jgi:hypothetical protein
VGPEHTAQVPATGSLTTQWTAYSRYTRWARAEVRRADQMVAMTNPIFLTK